MAPGPRNTMFFVMTPHFHNSTGEGPEGGKAEICRGAVAALRAGTDFGAVASDGIGDIWPVAVDALDRGVPGGVARTIISARKNAGDD